MLKSLNTLLYIYIYSYILYVCGQQPVTVRTACSHQDQVSGIPYTLSMDHPVKLMEVGQSCDVKQLLNIGWEEMQQFCKYVCTYMYVWYLCIFYYNACSDYNITYLYTVNSC